MSSIDPFFLELGIIIACAAFFGILAKLIKQPPLLGYLIAGIILGPLGASLIDSQEEFKAFSSIGIALLLFLVGLEMDWQKLKKLSNITGLLSLIQIIGVFLISFLISNVLGFNFSSSFVISLALALSSTVVVIKLISEKYDLDSLYGRLSVGVLLAQDIVAIFALAILAGSINSDQNSILINVLLLVAKTVGLVLLAIFSSYFILPRLFKNLARSAELLFVVSLAWCFLFAILTVSLGFSLEIGAFLAGLALASLPYSLDIVGRIKSLRDFFIILFFVILGAELNLVTLTDFKPIILFTLCVILIKPLLIMATLGWQGFRRRVSFQTGLSLGQTSEFSLVLAGLTLELNLINQNTASIIIITTALSLLISSYLISSSEKIFRILHKPLAIFERKTRQNSFLNFDQQTLPDNHVIIFGYHRMGYHILKTLKSLKQAVLVIDFNPEVVDRLNQANVPAIYGDIQDEDLFEAINLNQARMIISTIPHREETQFLIHRVKKSQRNIIIIVTSKSAEDALEFYKQGVDYVILPEQISGEHVADLLRKFEDKTISAFIKNKSNEVKLLKTKKQILYID